jgi:hypothetical protein
MSIFGAPSTPVAGASALFAPAVTTPANVGGTPRATDANGDDARRGIKICSRACARSSTDARVNAIESARGGR